MISFVMLTALLLPQTGTSCEIRGRITDRETGLPIVGAVASLRVQDGNDAQQARTDSDGRYRFSSLQPGEYAVFIRSGEFRRTHVSAVARPYPIVLKPGETRDNVDVSLVRTRTMTVRVVDDLGEPLARVAVMLKSVNGRERHSGPKRTTDDRGMLRLFDLEPGRYTVCADVGTWGSMSISRQTERFLRTCYPSTTSESDAETVALDKADVDLVEIRMRRGRAYTISGTVLDSSGAPPPPRSLVGLGYFEPGMSTSRSGHLELDGRFTFSNIVPGEYAIEVSIGGPERPEHRREAESAFVPVHVDSADVKDVVVQTAPTVQVAGRIVLEDPSASLPRRPGYAPISVWARLVGDPSRGSGSGQSGYADENREFYLGRLFGMRTLEIVNVPPGWYVKAIRYGGQDITDRPTEFKTSRDPSNLEVLLSTKGAAISGKVVNERGEGADGASVLVLQADQRRRSRSELTMARAAKDGAFKIGPLRRGDYVIVGLAASTPLPQPDDLEALIELARKGERVSLAENEERTIDARVVR